MLFELYKYISLKIDTLYYNYTIELHNYTRGVVVSIGNEFAHCALGLRFESYEDLRGSQKEYPVFSHSRF